LLGTHQGEHCWLRDGDDRGWEKRGHADCIARRHRPLRNGDADTDQSAVGCPKSSGGEHEWQPVSFVVETQLPDELVDDGHLAATRTDAASVRPLVDRHTILVLGEPLPTEAEQPTYTERDLYVSETTAERLKNKSKPKNTSRTYDNQRDLFRRWCETQGRVTRPCTTATYVEYVATLIEQGRALNAISVAMSAIRTWMPDDKKPGTTEARGMLNEYRKRVEQTRRSEEGPRHHRRHDPHHGRHL
jgi:hypothetical protein